MSTDDPGPKAPAELPTLADGFPGGGPTDCGAPSAVPPRTEEHLTCLRGPCRHYWNLVTMSQAGNPEGTWEHLGIDEPRQHHHVCTLNPAQEFEFTDGDNVYECSRWDPLQPGETAMRDSRREEYWRDYNARLLGHLDDELDELDELEGAEEGTDDETTTEGGGASG